MAVNRLKVLGIYCLLGGAALVGPMSAVAQTVDAPGIDIENRLAAAEAQVERLGEVLGVPIQLAQAVPENYAAQVELRLGQLEQSLRQLLGQVEQLQFQQRSLSDQLQRALNDIEFRLTELEGGDTSAILGGTSAPAPAPAPTPPPPSPSVDTGDAAPSLGPAVPPTTGGTLGSLSVAPGTEGAVPGSDEASQAYNGAFALVEAGDLAGAQGRLSSFVAQYPTHPLASNAQYWLGETYFAQGEFQEAANAFAQGYQRYPTGSKAMDSLFNLGLSLSALGRTADACNAYQQFLIRYPSAPQSLAQRARDELARLQCG